MIQNKTSKKQMIMSIVALILIFLIGVGVTYSWIEGGTTYSMQTEKTGDVKTNDVADSLSYRGPVTLNPNSSNPELSLLDYDKNTNQQQTLFFSPVYSSNGQTFTFPVPDSEGAVSSYRSATTNDIGTKFINFDFDVKATKKCYLAFSKAPTITATKSGSTIADTSAFRIMISNGTTSHFFSTASSNQTTTVVTNTSGSTATLTAKPFANYINTSDKSNKLFEYDKNAEGNIEVSIWLDAGADSAKLQGCSVSIDIQLIVVASDLTANFSAVTFNKAGTRVTDGFTGGSITQGGSSHTSAFEVIGTSFSATAVPKNSSYEFIGWYSDIDCTKLITDSTTLSHTPDDDISYYAKFQEVNKTIIYVEKRSGFSTYSVYAYQKVNGVATQFTGDWPGTAGTLDSTTGFYKLEFITPKTGNFNVIISNNGASQYPASGAEGLEGTLGGTYIFTADNKLEEFDPADMITFKTSVTPSGGGTATVSGVTANLSNKTSLKIRSGDSVTLKATPASGYKFVGWYKNSACTTTINSSYATASQTVTVTGTAGGTVTYYAKFEKIPVLTVNTSVTPSGGGTATVNSVTSTSVQTGTSVTLKATPASGYEFVGWYTNSGCTTTIGTNYSSASTTYTVSGSDGATVTLYAKFKVEDTTRTIYFKPTSDWASANAKFACYVWGGGNTEQWVPMTSVGDGVYSATIDKTYTSIIFSRFDPSVTTYNFDTDWNQSADLTLPTDGKNMLVLGSGWTGASGTWSTY